MSDKNPTTETPNTDELTAEELEALTAPDSQEEVPEEQEEQEEETTTSYGFFALGKASGGSGGGRAGRHQNPISTPITDPKVFEKHWIASGAKRDVNAMILYLSHNVGMTDSAIVKTFRTLVDGYQDMKQPRVYQTVDESMNKLNYLKIRIRTHRRLDFNCVIDHPNFGKTPAQAYREVDEEERKAELAAQEARETG